MKVTVASLTALVALATAQPLEITEIYGRELSQSDKEAAVRDAYRNARVKDISCSESDPDSLWYLCESLCRGPPGEEASLWGPGQGVIGFWLDMNYANSTMPFRPFSLKCWLKEDWDRKEELASTAEGGRPIKDGIWSSSYAPARQTIADGRGGIVPFYNGRDRSWGEHSPFKYSPFNDGSLSAWGRYGGPLHIIDESMSREDQRAVYNQITG